MSPLVTNLYTPIYAHQPRTLACQSPQQLDAIFPLIIAINVLHYTDPSFTCRACGSSYIPAAP
ncbi:unnamed protein product [Ixodes pacificus]